MKNRKNIVWLSLSIGIPFLAAYSLFCFLIASNLPFKTSIFLASAFIGANALLATSLMVTLLIPLLLSKRLRIFGFAIYFSFLAFFLSSSLYFKYFYSVLSPYVLHKIAYLPNVTGQMSYLISGADYFVLILGILGFLAIYLITRSIRKINSSLNLRPFILIFIGILSLMAIKGYIVHKKSRDFVGTYSHSRNKAVLIHGFFPVFIYDAALYFRYTSSDIPWPGRIEDNLTLNPLSDNKSHQIPELKNFNVITIQVESLDYEVLFYELAGKPVMPFLQKLAQKSYFGKHFFAQHRGGGSSDAELSAMTSLLPLDELTGFSQGDFSRTNTLPRLLSKQGFYTAAMHAYDGTFYDRTKIYKQMGFERFDDASAFTGQAPGWNSKDQAFFMQVADKIKDFSTPFYLHLVTMQSHGPFENHSPNEGRFDLSQIKDKLFSGYLLTMNEVDRALETFANHLNELNLLDHTVLLIYSDHSAAHRSNFEYGGVKNGEICSGEKCIHLGDRVPLIIYSKALQPKTIQKVGSHLDIAPTIMQLLGYQSDESWLGTSLLNGKLGLSLLNNNPLTAIQNDGKEISLLATDLERFKKYYDYSAYRLFK